MGLGRPKQTAPVLGINSVRSALKLHPGDVVELWLDQQRRDRRLAELSEMAAGAGLESRTVARDALDLAGEGGNHQGVIAWVRMPAALDDKGLDRLLDQLSGPPLLLVLDAVTDPHNLGACLRCADGAGASAVIVPKDKAVGLTPVVVKVASGAASSVPLVQVTNLARSLSALQARGIWAIGLADQASASLFETDLKGPVALVLGSEGSGLRRLTRERCDLLAALPMQGQVESLNVSVAAGVCLYEALRQRGPSLGRSVGGP